MKRFNPLRLERLEDRMTPSGVTDPMQSIVTPVPDAPNPVQVSPISPDGGTVSFGVGLGLLGPNGPVNPVPPPSGPVVLLPVILPVPPAFGNLYPTAPVTPIDMTPVAPAPAPATPISMTPSY